MQKKKSNELMAEAFRLLDDMSKNGGVYPKSTTLNRYTNVLDTLKQNPSIDVYNFTLEIMTKIYYLRDSEECLFANLLLDQTYHTLKMNNGVKVSDIHIF